MSDQQTDGQTDLTSFRDVWAHLKSKIKSIVKEDEKKNRNLFVSNKKEDLDWVTVPMPKFR